MGGKSIEQMRAEFEAWQLKNMLERGVSEAMARASLSHKDGKYGPFVEFAWEIWQASRASLVVELPAAKQVTHAGEKWIGAIAEQEYRDACRAAIEAAGVKVKA